MFCSTDYSEMYRIDGGSQQGRNDTAKLGHITLEIYEKDMSLTTTAVLLDA